MKPLKHAAFTLTAIFLLAVLPIALHFPVFQKDAVDAVSGSSLVLPDQPSGAFIVLINTSMHRDTLDDWTNFFTDSDFAVIFEDIRCLTAAGDVTGSQLAQRYQAQLPENQMTLREENPVLLASKAENGYIDVAVFSREMADALALSYRSGIDGVTVIEVGGND